jgi:hypothetical protein
MCISIPTKKNSNGCPIKKECPENVRLSGKCPEYCNIPDIFRIDGHFLDIFDDNFRTFFFYRDAKKKKMR